MDSMDAFIGKLVRESMETNQRFLQTVQVLSWLKSGEVTLDRLEILGPDSFRILPKEDPMGPGPEGEISG